jgi:ribonuclease D
LEEELEIACQAVEEASWNGAYRAEGFWNLKGATKLDEVALATLAGLWEWRDAMAQKRDLPAGKILAQRLLLALARQRPRSMRELRRLGVPERSLRLVGGELLGELGRLQRSERTIPPRPARGRQPSSQEKSRSQRLREWRRQEATRRRVSEQAVLPSRALEHLARRGAGDLGSTPMLGDKRQRLYGDTLRRLAGAGGAS